MKDGKSAITVYFTALCNFPRQRIVHSTSRSNAAVPPSVARAMRCGAKSEKRCDVFALKCPENWPKSLGGRSTRPENGAYCTVQYSTVQSCSYPRFHDLWGPMTTCFQPRIGEAWGINNLRVLTTTAPSSSQFISILLPSPESVIFYLHVLRLCFCCCYPLEFKRLGTIHNALDDVPCSNGCSCCC